MIHVEVGADDEGDLEGDDWTEATYFRRALELAVQGDQIWMKGGLYSLNEGVEQALFPFLIPIGVAVFGGFQGDESHLIERNLTEGNQTVLTGDLEGDDQVNPVSGVTPTPGDRVGRNAAIIVGIIRGDRSTVLDGVTVTGAQPASSPTQDGALSIFRGSPTIRNCRFIGNEWNSRGCVTIDESPEAIIANCLFVDNKGDDSGGVIVVDFASPLIVNCTFARYEVDGDGYAIAFLTAGSGTVANCIFWNDPLPENETPETATSFISISNFPPLLVGNVIQGGVGEVALGEPLLDGGDNVSTRPQFIEGSFRLRADSPARLLGRGVFLPTDSSDLDGDGDFLEALPIDLSGRVIPFSVFGRRCDAGCFQYEPTTDSDLDGYSDSFERTVTGTFSDLYIPLITGLSVGEDAVSLDFKFMKNIRDYTDFVFEGSVLPSGPWTIIDSRRRRSTLLNEREISEGRELMALPGQRFFRVRTVEPK